MKEKLVPKVSVIVPCYNVEPWVERCLESLVNQTLSDIEIICIDDKSIDNTLKVLGRFVKKDKRIKLIAHKNNMGVSASRNDGLKAACGDYVGFVDPDDFVDFDFYEKLYERAIDTDADVVKAGIRTVDLQNGRQTVNNKIPKHISDFSGAFWSAIYKRDFLNRFNIKFDEKLILGEDTLFVSNVVLNTSNIQFIKDTCYNYFYQRPGSLDSRTLSHVRAESIYSSVIQRLKLIENASLSHHDKELFIDKHVLFQIKYNIFKTFEVDADRKKLFDLLTDIYQKYGLKRYFIHRFKGAYFKFIKTSNYGAFINYKLKRFYLFYFLPIIRMEYTGKKIYIKLFGFIPLFKIR